LGPGRPTAYQKTLYQLAYEQIQHNIDIIGRKIWRNMLQPKFQSAASKIDNQRPLGIAVAVSAHDSDSRSDCAQLIQNRWLAHIAQMPDLVRVARKIDNFLRQLVMSIRDNKYPCHIEYADCFQESAL